MFLKVKVKVVQSCLTLCYPHGLYSPWNSPGQNAGVGSLSLLQGIFPTQESSQGLLHCRRILYQLSSQGSPRPWLYSVLEFLVGFSSLMLSRVSVGACESLTIASVCFCLSLFLCPSLRYHLDLLLACFFFFCCAGS